MTGKKKRVWKNIKKFLIYPLIGISLLWIIVLGVGLMTGDLKIKYTPAVVDTSRVSTDGPLFWANEDSTFVGYYTADQGATVSYVESLSGQSFDVLVPEPLHGFKISIDSSDYPDEPDIYAASDNIVAISDIEGNFNAMTDALLSSSVIDSNYNWIFNDGHLVFLGDMVDRGLHVNQVLWLIYKLEKEAKASGGKVHFILGNHEVMNMAGDLRYVRNKYIELAKKFNVEYTDQIFGESGVFGRWMRSKNVVEKIGNILFVHGGISYDIYEKRYSIHTMNEISKKYYGASKSTLRESKEAQLMFGDKGPFWYRGYVEEDLDKNEMKAILDYYEVDRIVIGHSIVDSIQTFYNKSVIDIDLKQPESGKNTRCLLIEKGRFNEISSNGGKRLII